MATKTRSRRVVGELKTKHFAWRLFLSTHAFLTSRINKELDDAGLIPFDSYDVLMALHEAPDGRLRMSDLAEAVLLSNSGMSRRVERLESDGLLTRQQSATDGRSTIAILTKKGQRALEEAWPVYKEGIEQYFTACLSRKDAETLAELFNEMLERVGAPHHQHSLNNHSNGSKR